MTHTTSDTPQVPSSPFLRRFFGAPGLLCLAVLLSDQLSKLVIDCAVPVGWSRSVIPGVFNLVHWRNTGAAWSMLNQYTWFLALTSVVCLVGLVVFFDKLSEGKAFPAMLLGVLAGGIAGNMIDRVFRQSVIDFLDFHWYESYHYPAFNIADMAICISMFLLVILSFSGGKKAKSTEKGS